MKILRYWFLCTGRYLSYFANALQFIWFSFILTAGNICCWFARRNCCLSSASSWFYGVRGMYVLLVPFLLLVLSSFRALIHSLVSGKYISWWMCADLLIYFFKISAHRHFGETNMNLYSSRSHTIFRMVMWYNFFAKVVSTRVVHSYCLITQIIESRDKTEDDNTSNSCDAVRVSVLVCDSWSYQSLLLQVLFFLINNIPILNLQSCLRVCLSCYPELFFCYFFLFVYRI